MRVINRQTLKDYCLRKLGAPVLLINVAPEQIDDRIDEALDKFWEFHGQGSEKKFIATTLTDADIVNQYISLPDSVMTVLRVLPLNVKFQSNFEYQSFITDILKFKQRDERGLGDWTIIQSYMSLLEESFNYEKPISFNQHQNKLKIYTDWNQLNASQIIIAECNVLIDPIEYEEVYNNIWLKSYTTSLIKKQWGQNMIKYDGVQLPSGITLNGRQIYDDAVNEIEILENELQTTWQQPVDFLVG